MELAVIATLIMSTVVTFYGIFAKTTKQLIRLLAVQAATLGLVELALCLINLILGLGFEALVDFFATFSEWFAAAVITPLIIYWGMIKTENIRDEPVVNVKRVGLVLVAIVILSLILSVFASRLLPEKIDALPFVALMFSISVFIIATRTDPLKILWREEPLLRGGEAANTLFSPPPCLN